MATSTEMLNNFADPAAPISAPANNPFEPQPAKTKSNSKAWIIAPIAGGSALVFGGLGVGAYALLNKDEEVVPAPSEADTELDDVIDDEYQDDEVVDVMEDEADTEVYAVTFDPSAVHQSFAANDSMSFAEAFAAARQDVGTGGVFVWHGGIYGTYTADEWNSMSPDDQLAFTSNFYLPAPEQETLFAEEPVLDPIVDNPNEVALVTEEEDPEIMLISQEYDSDNDMTVAYVTDGDNVVMLADVDNDGTYDFLVSDYDDNGEISDDEIVDISDSNLTQAEVSSLPDFYTAAPYDDVNV